MEKIMKNKKSIIYLILILIVIAGMISIYVRRLNFSLEQGKHIRIDLYIGKEYELEDIKQIAKETLPEGEKRYQKLETFNDAVAISLKEASDEQINALKEKVKEKYGIEEDTFLTKTEVPHLRTRDIIKPYIIPTIIVTLIIMGYVGVRFLKLGALKTMFLLVAKLVLAGLVYVGVIGLFYLPVGIYTIPVGIGIYLIVAMTVIVGYQNQLEKKEVAESKK